VANNGLIGLLSLASGVGQGYERGEEQKKADYIKSQANDRATTEYNNQQSDRTNKIIIDALNNPLANNDIDEAKNFAIGQGVTAQQWASHPLVNEAIKAKQEAQQSAPSQVQSNPSSLQAPPAHAQTTGQPGVTAPQVQAPAQQQDVTQSTPRLTAPPNDENSFRQSVGMPYRTAQGAMIIPNAANRYHYGLPEAAFNIHYMNNEVGNIDRQNGLNPPQSPVAQGSPPPLNAAGNTQQGAFPVAPPNIGQ
jgi:hypothetical protein